MLILKEQVHIAQTPASVPNPPAGYVAIFVDSTNGHLSQKNSAGVVIDLTQTGAGGSVTLTEVEIDFGTFDAPVTQWTITDGAVGPTNKILVFPSPNPGTGRIGNDWEGDRASFTAVAGTGDFLLTASPSGRMVGARKVYYQVI